MKKNNTMIYIILGIFAFLGILSLIMGVSKLVASGVSKATNDTVVAEITTISQQKNPKGEISYFVFVDYEYEGEEYKEVSLGVYTASMHEGKQIDILVNPKEPTDIKIVAQDTIDAVGGIFMGIIFALVGIVPLIFIYKGKQRVKNLMEAGYYVYATVDRVEKNYSVSSNRKHPYAAYCTYEDETTGRKYKFKSPDMWKNPEPIIQIGTRLKVYVDRNNYANYYVDVDSLF